MGKKVIAGLVLALGALLFAANYHIIYGSDVSGINLQKKLSPSLSETIVNLDAVGGMPMLVARSQYPLFTEALVRKVNSVKKDDKGPCGKIYAGMLYPQAEALCGRPEVMGNSSNGEQTYYFSGGVSATVKNNVITDVRK